MAPEPSKLGFYAELEAIKKSVRGLDGGEPIDFWKAIARFEWLLLNRALEVTGGNMGQAAKLLKVHPELVRGKLVRSGRHVG